MGQRIRSRSPPRRCCLVRLRDVSSLLSVDTASLIRSYVDCLDHSYHPPILKHHNQALATLAGILCVVTGWNIPTPALQVNVHLFCWFICKYRARRWNICLYLPTNYSSHVQSAREPRNVTSDRATIRKYAPALWSIDPFAVTEWSLSMFVLRRRKSAGI